MLKAVGRALVPRFGWLMTPSRAPAAVNSAGGACRRGWRWLLVVVLAYVLAAACTSQQREQPAPTSRSATVAGQRDYWPTAGWRTAPPARVGMDPKVLAVLDTNVAYHPQLRSLLVVRHGYLVYERYWNGDAHSGQEAFSVTKSFTAALVGIALGDHHLKSLNQTVGELLAAHLPPTADPRLAKVTVGQLLTMPSGLAGDDPSLTGDFDLLVRLYQSRDWVRHILGRKLVTRPGTAFAYSNASSHLLRRSWPTPPGAARWRSPAPSCSAHLASTPSMPSSRSTPSSCREPRRRHTSGPTWPGPTIRRATTPASQA